MPQGHGKTSNRKAYEIAMGVLFGADNSYLQHLPAVGTNAADRKRTKDRYVLQISSQEHIIDLLEQVLPYLIEKRGCAEAMLAFCHSRLNRPSFKDSQMPLTSKGKKILKAMKRGYGKNRGTRVFYASANKKTIKGVHRKKK